jgi:hypothetical protein
MPQDSPRLPVIRYCSTDEVSWAQRLDYWSSILSDVLVPMTIGSDDKRNFSASMVTASFGPPRVTRCQGSAHDSWRTREHVERSKDRFFHLLISLDSSWRFSHRGKAELQRGANPAVFGRFSQDPGSATAFLAQKNTPVVFLR